MLRRLVYAVLPASFLIAAGPFAGFGDLRNLDDAHTNSHLSTNVYRTLPQWESRRAQLRKQILVSAGLWPMPDKVPLNARRFGRHQFETYSTEKVVFQTFDGLFLAGNLYLPARALGKLPGVLVAHGHWKRGRVHNDPDYSPPALAANLASQGYAVFTYDMLGYNDSKQLRHRFGDTTAERMWSFGPLGIQLLNSIRAVDFLAAQPEVDPERLGMTGASGGGTQTFLAAAVDERIRAAAPVDMVSGYFQGDDACEMAPGLRIDTNNLEFAAMMAPRPLLLVSSTQDWTKHTPFEEYPEIRRIYKLYGKENLIHNYHLDAPHNYNRQSREAVYAFFKRALAQDSETSVQETVTTLPAAEDLLLGDDFSAGKRYPEQNEIFRRWRRNGRRQIRSIPADQAREVVRSNLRIEWPQQVESLSTGEQWLLMRPGYGDRVPMRWMAADGGTVLAVSKQGSAAALNQREVRRLRDEGYSALAIDVYQTGMAVAPRTPPRSDHLLFHLSDDAQRVQDIVTALAWLSEGAPTSIRLVCDRGAALWCKAAAAVSEMPVDLVIPALPRRIDLEKELMIPGIRRAGGLRMLDRLVASAKRQLSGPRSR